MCLQGLEMRGDISHAPNVPLPSLPSVVKIFLLLTLFSPMSFTYHSHLSKLLWRWTAVLWSIVASRLHAWGFQEKREVLRSWAGKTSRTLERPSQKRLLPSSAERPQCPWSQALFRKAEQEQQPPELKSRKAVGGCHLLQEMQKSWTSPCLLSPGRHDLTMMKIMRSM